MKVIDEEVLDMLFAQFGDVADVIVKRHNASDRGYHRQRGYCFVSFYDRSVALSALQSMRSIVLDHIRFDCSLSKHSSSNSLSSHVFTDSKNASIDSNEAAVSKSLLTVRGPSELVPGWTEPPVVTPAPATKHQPHFRHESMIQTVYMEESSQASYYSVSNQSQPQQLLFYPPPQAAPYHVPPVPLFNYLPPMVPLPSYPQQYIVSAQQPVYQQQMMTSDNISSSTPIITNVEQQYHFNNQTYRYQQFQPQHQPLAASSWPPYSHQVAPTLPNFHLPRAQSHNNPYFVDNNYNNLNNINHSNNNHYPQFRGSPLSPQQQHQLQQQRSWPPRRDHSG